jgi:hypothetical protein
VNWCSVLYTVARDTEIPEVTASPCNSSAVTWRSPFSRRSCAGLSD